MMRIYRTAMLLLALAIATFACSGGTDDKDVSAPEDGVQTDGRTPDDLVTEDSLQPDVPVEDTNEPDAADLASDDQDTTQDVVVELPRLPPNKTFTTRYAAGAGRVVVTPEGPVRMGGFGMCTGKPDACRVSEGVHDDISASAVAIADTQTGEVVIFVGLDVVGMFLYDVRLIHEAAEKAFAETHGVLLEGARVVVSSSHSHASPDTAGIWGAMEGEVRDDEEYIAFVRESVVQAALEAFGNLEDVKLEWATSQAPNHTDDKDADDEEVYVVRGFRPADDSTVFTLTRWVGHPTSYGSGNNAISADYPGTFRKRLEEDLGGTAVYVNGPIGSTYADHPDGCDDPDDFPEGWQDPDFAGNPSAHAKASCVGHNLASAVTTALEAPQAVEETGLIFRHNKIQFKPDNPILVAFALMGPIPLPNVNPDDPNSDMEAEFSWVTLGQLDFVTTPGESFPSFAKKAKDIMAAGGITTPIVMGVSQDWIGYLLTAEQWAGSDSDLQYHKGLSPGRYLEPAYMQKLTEIVGE